LIIIAIDKGGDGIDYTILVINFFKNYA